MIHYLIVGSQSFNTAIHHERRDYLNYEKQCKDVDVFCTREDFDTFMEFNSKLVSAVKPIDKRKFVVITNDKTIYEFELIDGTSLEILFQFINENPSYAIHNSMSSSYMFPYIEGSFGVGVSHIGLDIQYMLKLSHRYLRNSPFF